MPHRKPRALVITLGQLRGGDVTWGTFKNHVLDELNADLAVCVPTDDHVDIKSPFYRHARYRWLIPYASDMAHIFDMMQSVVAQPSMKNNWRALLDVPGHWLGGISEANQTIKGSVELALRWFMVDHLRSSGLVNQYDWFVVTRSDFYYLAPHPPLNLLDDSHLWIPDGEDFGGYCTRHLIAHSSSVLDAVDILSPLLGDPTRAARAMRSSNSVWNIEKVLARHLDSRWKVARFPYVMFLVKNQSDPSSTVQGRLSQELGTNIKYESEYRDALAYSTIIKSYTDWKRYLEWIRFRPKITRFRVFTAHGTLLYWDELAYSLKHGDQRSVPANAVLQRSDDRSDLLLVTSRDERACSFRASVADDASVIAAAGRHVNFTMTLEGSAHWPNSSCYMNNLFSIKHKIHYLSAEPNGTVALNRSQCGAWEKFRLIPLLSAADSVGAG